MCQYQTTCGYLACTFRVPGANWGWCDVISFTETCSQDSPGPIPPASCHRTSGTFRPSCWIAPASTPPSGGGPCSSDYCAGAAQCASQGGTTGGSGPRPSGGNCSSGTVMCCIGGGGGGGGGGGDPCPGDTCAGTCCNYQCGQPCIVTADCKNPSAGGQPTYCNPTTHTCVNANCPDNTIPGAICGCSGGLVCGQKCAGGCTNNSTCRFTNAPGGSCTDPNSTYCIGDTGNGINTYNPSYTTPRCLSGDTGNNYLLGPGGQSTGFTQAQIDSTCKPGAWWQVKDGDVITNGKIQSVIPIACTLPGCNPNFNLNGTGTYPGIVMYGSSSTPVFTAAGGQGKVSTKNWLANTSYMGKTYDYSFFEGLVPSTVTVNEITTDTINGNYFQQNGTPSNNFVWFRRTGNLTITGNVNVNSTRKVILLVKGGNLTESAQIRLKKTGDGFFMAIVNGSINFDPALTGSGGQPAVEGLFLADNQIHTGAGSEQLYVRGTLAAIGGIVLERDLQANNANTPGEFIEYAPDLIFSYPRDLTRTRVIWREVAP